VLAGEAQCGPCDPAALSERERARGFVLAFRSTLRSDAQVAWLAAPPLASGAGQFCYL
jgi:hypothetical protein